MATGLGWEWGILAAVTYISVCFHDNRSGRLQVPDTSDSDNEVFLQQSRITVTFHDSRSGRLKIPDANDAKREVLLQQSRTSLCVSLTTGWGGCKRWTRARLTARSSVCFHDNRSGWRARCFSSSHVHLCMCISMTTGQGGWRCQQTRATRRARCSSSNHVHLCVFPWQQGGERGVPAAVTYISVCVSMTTGQDGWRCQQTRATRRARCSSSNHVHLCVFPWQQGGGRGVPAAVTYISVCVSMTTGQDGWRCQQTRATRRARCSSSNHVHLCVFPWQQGGGRGVPAAVTYISVCVSMTTGQDGWRCQQTRATRRARCSSSNHVHLCVFPWQQGGGRGVPAAVTYISVCVSMTTGQDGWRCQQTRATRRARCSSSNHVHLCVFPWQQGGGRGVPAAVTYISVCVSMTTGQDGWRCQQTRATRRARCSSSNHVHLCVFPWHERCVCESEVFLQQSRTSLCVFPWLQVRTANDASRHERRGERGVPAAITYISVCFHDMSVVCARARCSCSSHVHLCVCFHDYRSGRLTMPADTSDAESEADSEVFLQQSRTSLCVFPWLQVRAADDASRHERRGERGGQRGVPAAVTYISVCVSMTTGQGGWRCQQTRATRRARRTARCSSSSWRSWAEGWTWRATAPASWPWSTAPTPSTAAPSAWAPSSASPAPPAGPRPSERPALRCVRTPWVGHCDGMVRRRLSPLCPSERPALRCVRTPWVGHCDGMVRRRLSPLCPSERPALRCVRTPVGLCDGKVRRRLSPLCPSERPALRCVRTPVGLCDGKVRRRLSPLCPSERPALRCVRTPWVGLCDGKVRRRLSPLCPSERPALRCVRTPVGLWRG